jgi:hypothetical protein
MAHLTSVLIDVAVFFFFFLDSGNAISGPAFHTHGLHAGTEAFHNDLTQVTLMYRPASNGVIWAEYLRMHERQIDSEHRFTASATKRGDIPHIR